MKPQKKIKAWIHKIIMMTKEEIALELVKLITPTDRPPVIISSIDSNSTKVANAYKKILKATKGYRMLNSRVFSRAKNAWMKA